MPTYEYACAECGERLEVVQRITDEPLTVCPNCSGRLRKVFSPVGVVFKGSGFYRTDSRPSKSSESAKSSESSTSSDKSNTSSDKSKETKPASETKSSTGKSDKVA